MRNVIVLAVAFAMMGLGVAFVRADDKADSVKMTGVVIDQMCAKKMASKDKPQEAAAAHDKACCLKCGADGGYAIMSDGKVTKLSKDSSDKVKDYLSKDDAKTNVMIEGTKNADGEVTVTSIMAAEEKK